MRRKVPLAVAIIFAAGWLAGCWEVTGVTGDKTVTFVMELTE